MGCREYASIFSGKGRKTRRMKLIKFADLPECLEVQLQIVRWIDSKEK